MLMHYDYARIQSFIRGGPNLTMVFFSVDKEREDPNTTISRPFKWQFAGEVMANIECWLGLSFVIFQGIRTSIPKKPYIFVIFSPTSGSAHDDNP